MLVILVRDGLCCCWHVVWKNVMVSRQRYSFHGGQEERVTHGVDSSPQACSQWLISSGYVVYVNTLTTSQ